MNTRRLAGVLVGVSLVLGTGAGRPPDAPPSDMRRKADAIVVPSMDLEEAPLGTAVEALRKESERLDPAGQGVNFMLKLDRKRQAANDYPLITMSFRNITLGDVIRYLCMAAGLHYRIDRNAVIIADRQFPLDRMETRFYPAQAGVFDTRKTRTAKAFDLDEDDD